MMGKIYHISSKEGNNVMDKNKVLGIFSTVLKYMRGSTKINLHTVRSYLTTYVYNL